jgi:hypothetical protein
MSSYDTRPDVLQWTAAERERLMRHIAVLPNPRRVAESLSRRALLALIHSVADRHGGYTLLRADWKSPHGKVLVSAGLVENGWGGVGNFGILVRREAIRMKLDGELE